MIKELNSIGLTDCSNMMKNEYQQLNAEIESSESLAQKKVGDFGATFWEQERVAIKILNG